MSDQKAAETAKKVAKKKNTQNGENTPKKDAAELKPRFRVKNEQGEEVGIYGALPRHLGDEGDPNFDWGEDPPNKEEQEANEIMRKAVENIQAVYPGDVVEGTVVHTGENYFEVKIGNFKNVFVDKKYESNKELENVRVGDHVPLKIKRTDDPELGVIGSYGDVLQSKKESVLIDSIGEKDVAYKAKIEELVNGGFTCDVDGVKCFMPGSLVSMNRTMDYESYVGKTLNVLPVNFTEGSIVVSHKDYLKTLVPERIQTLEIGSYYEGSVTGVTNFGVFVEFEEYLTGLVHMSDLDKDTKQKFKKGQIKAGDPIDFYLKDVTKIKDEKRLILTQLKERVSGQMKKWAEIEQGEDYEGTVDGVTDHGLFVEIDDGVVGLAHISNMEESPEHFEKGDRVRVRVNKVDPDKKKASLALV